MSPRDPRAHLPFGGICGRALLYALEYARAQAAFTGEDPIETQRRALEAQLEGVMNEELRRRARLEAEGSDSDSSSSEVQLSRNGAGGAERPLGKSRCTGSGAGEESRFVLTAPLSHRPASPLIRVVQSGPDWSEVVRLECVEFSAPKVPVGEGVYAIESRERYTQGAWTPVQDADSDQPLLVPAGLMCRVGVGDPGDPTLEFRAMLVAWQCSAEEAMRLTTLDLAPLLASNVPALRAAALNALPHAAPPSES